MSARPGRVLGYARVSSEEQARGTSLQDQQEALTQYAAARGLGVHRFYVEAESAIGQNIEKREQIQLLMREARAGDLVVCDKLDRWSRDAEFTYGSIRKLLERGASFYAVGDRCDPSTRDGDTMLGVRVLVAREEYKRLRERTVGTRRILRDKGYWVEGVVPLGYMRPTTRGISRLERNALVPEERGAAALREAFRLCVRGQSVSDIMEHLRVEHSYRIWDKKVIGTALRNRFYLGDIRDTRGVWIKGQHPALIDGGLFARAQAALDGRRLGGARATDKSKTRDWLLRKIGRCARCGTKLGAAYGGGIRGTSYERHYYFCRARPKCPTPYVHVPLMDAEVATMALDRLVELRHELARAPAHAKASPKTTDFAAERAKLQRRRDRHLEAFADSAMTKDELRRLLAKVDEARMKLDAREADGVQPAPLADPKARRELLAQVENIRTAWGRLGGAKRRGFLERLASDVRIEKGKPPVIAWRSVEDLAADERL